jgi:hypothetical protein
VETLSSNLRALEVEWTDELEARCEGLREESEDYWARRSSLPWN